MNAVEVEGLKKSFGRVLAVDDVTFSIPMGKVTGFLGPNGAGKSTTLRMIVGLVRPDAGATTILGRRFVALDDPARTVGALLDVDQFHPQRTARNHLRVIATAAGIEHDRVDEVLGMVDLTHAARRKVGGYSLGMKQRLGLAAALLGNPRVLVLDEPANGLDPAGIRWLRGLLKGFAREGRGVFVSSHQLGEMAEIADDVVVIDRGRLVTHAPVSDLVGHSSGALRVITPDADRLARLLADRGIEIERLSPDALRIRAGRGTVASIAAEARVPILGLDDEERSLEEVFFELTQVAERSA